MPWLQPQQEAPTSTNPSKGAIQGLHTDLFNQQYKDLFGEGELVKLGSKLDEHNKQVNEQRK
jgi:hypothetical protein